MVSLAEWVKDKLEPNLSIYKAGELVPFHCMSISLRHNIIIVEVKETYVRVLPTYRSEEFGISKMNFDGTWVDTNMNDNYHIDWENPR